MDSNLLLHHCNGFLFLTANLDLTQECAVEYNTTEKYLYTVD